MVRLLVHMNDGTVYPEKIETKTKAKNRARNVMIVGYVIEDEKTITYYPAEEIAKIVIEK